MTVEQGRGVCVRVRWRRRDCTRCERQFLGRRGDCFVGLGRIPDTDTYPQAYSKNCEINKKSDTEQILIGSVSDAVSVSETYPIRDMLPQPRMHVT